MTNPDVVIAGGGIVGLMTGWTLARAGVRVIVIDAGVPAATNAAAGMLAPSFEGSLHKAGDALAEFSMASLRRWREIRGPLEEEAGLAIDFDESGILSAAFDEGEAEAFEKDKEGGEWLRREDVLALEPSLSPSVLGGWFAREDGQVDPRKALRALSIAFCKRGGELRRGKRVTEILSADGQITGVRLHDGERLIASTAIVATGARIAGLADLPAGAAFPVKGEALAIERVAGSPARVVRTSRAYLCPKSDGRVVIGASEVKGDWSIAAEGERINALRAGADAAAPALKAARELERWAGLRPATADGAPVLGEAPGGPKGLLYALGHYRNGILLAPATADALAALVTKGRLSNQIAAFSAARFSNLGVS